MNISQLPLSFRALGLLALIALLLPAVSCETLFDYAKDLTEPEMELVDYELQDLTLSGATLVYEVEVTNPYTVPLPLTNLGYALNSNGTTLLTGSAKTQGLIPARGRDTLELPVDVKFAEVLKALQSTKPGSVVPYNATLVLQGEVPEYGLVSLPVRKKGELPIPAVPRVELTGLDWNELTLNRASATATLRVTNTNQFPVDLDKMGYELALAGKDVVSASVKNPPKLNAGSSAELQVPLRIKPSDLGAGFFNMMRGSDSTYALSGSVEADTPYGPVQLPFARDGIVLFGE